MDEIQRDRIDAKRDRRIIMGILRRFTDIQVSMLKKQDLMIEMQKDGNKRLGNIEKYLRIRGNGSINGKNAGNRKMGTATILARTNRIRVKGRG